MGDFRIIGEESNAKEAKQVFVCGDEPSGVALNESTKIPVLCGNDLKAVAEAARERYGKDVEIIVAGDKDRPQIAEEAAKAVDGKAIVPQFTPRQEAKGCNTFGDLVKEAGRLEMTMQMKANLTSDREQAALDKRDRVVNRGKDDRSM